MNQSLQPHPLANIAPGAGQSQEAPSSESESVVSSTAARSDLVVNEKNGLKSEEDGLYFTFPEKGGADALIAALDSVFKEGAVIKDFEYATVMDALLGKADFPEGRFRVGGERVPMDAEKLPAFDRAIIGGEQEGYYEFFA